LAFVAIQLPSIQLLSAHKTKSSSYRRKPEHSRRARSGSSSMNRLELDSATSNPTTPVFDAVKNAGTDPHREVGSFWPRHRPTSRICEQHHEHPALTCSSTEPKHFGPSHRYGKSKEHDVATFYERADRCGCSGTGRGHDDKTFKVDAEFGGCDHAEIGWADDRAPHPIRRGLRQERKGQRGRARTLRAAEQHRAPATEAVDSKSELQRRKERHQVVAGDHRRHSLTREGSGELLARKRCCTGTPCGLLRDRDGQFHHREIVDAIRTYVRIAGCELTF
jgi:hypothetical protein